MLNKKEKTCSEKKTTTDYEYYEEKKRWSQERTYNAIFLFL